MTATSVFDYDVVRLLRERVADRMTRTKQERERHGSPELRGADEQQLAHSLITSEVQRYLADLLSAGHELPTDEGFDLRLIAAVDAAMYRAGELQELLDDSDIENIDINGSDEVFITFGDARGKVRGAPIAGSDDELIGIIQNLASYAGINARPFTRASPELDLRLPDGSRLSAVMAASERPIVSIRRNRFPQMFLSDLVDLGTIDERLACFLEACVRARMNIVIGGATDAGKTTLLRALINCIEPDERLITVERALELGLRRHPDLHADVVELEEVLPDPDGSGGLTIRELVRRTRRHNPSRVIVGEVLGPEVVEMLSAMSQGNNGSLSTLHARSAADVFNKLAQYAGQYERVDFPVAQSLIAGAVDFVVFIGKNRLLGGRRCVTQVLEVAGAPDGQVASSTIFAASPFDGRAIRVDDVALGLDRGVELADAGYDDTAGHHSYPPVIRARSA
ncbi:CpaF family protein [Nakamurella multipartita]|uniref:Type II secretion system protein E n=1 Tax=Nakamurella multipartita (strain ATCC 700099 / DSM 44233 / CIP 104796 / JCM 9543 / NBRC 105858 / Y-104) TaxID=479431 RepID=C8X8Q3_NAKMY|nr:ATPase, T2SS/T4P/T4SS family [Nakamurella multipartita]ACV79108.1 type II secretion system protein E [Nakamurella multipartita DSM 44233]